MDIMHVQNKLLRLSGVPSFKVDLEVFPKRWGYK